MWVERAGPAPAPEGALRLEPAPVGPPSETGPACLRCGFPVNPRPWGCKNPCANCGTVYPLGDCSD